MPRFALIIFLVFSFELNAEAANNPALNERQLNHLFNEGSRCILELKTDSIPVFANKILEHPGVDESDEWMGKGLYLISQFYKANFRFDTTAFILIQAQKHFQKINDKTYLAKVYNELGLIYSELNNFELSKKYKLDALSTFFATRDYDNQAVLMNNLGGDYLALDVLDSSIMWFSRALELKPKLDKNKNVLVLAATGRSSAFFFNGEPEKAWQDLELAKKYADEFGEPYQKIEVKHREADLLYLTGNYKACIDSCFRLKNLFSTQFNLRDEYLNYERLAWSFKELKQSDSAIKYFMLFQLYKDSIENKESRDALNTKFARFEVNELAYKTKLAEAVSVRERNQKFFLFIICLIAITGIILILLYFRKYKIQKELTIQSQRDSAEKTIAYTREILSNQSQLILEKNRIIDELNESLSALFSNGDSETGDFENLLESKILTREDWIKFKTYFQMIYPEFLEKAHQKFEGLSESEERLLCLFKTGMKSSEVASMLGILSKSVSKNLRRFKMRYSISSDLSAEDIIGFIG